MKKIRILVANAPEEVGGVTCWRMFWPLSLLEQRHGDTLDIRYSRGVIYPFEFYQTDILLCYRPSKPEHFQVMQEAKRFGIKIVVDFDDNHRDIPVGHPAYWSLAAKWNITAECLKLADLVWISTEGLRPVYEHQNIAVVQNAISPEIVAKEPQDFSARAGVWAGSDAHAEDAATFSESYWRLLRVLDRFTWINYMPTWASSKDVQGATVQLHPWVHTEMYFEWLRKMRTTAIWKPLRSLPFNDGKSNIAWITATAVGAVCVSTYAGKPGWECAVKEIPKGKSEFEDVWTAAKAEITKNYNLHDVNEIRFASLLKLVHG